jgi:inosine/xanthosine triphosphate pyrophosphatase family protein
VLVIPGRNCYLGELGDEEEAQISQRRIALLKLRDELERIAAGRVAG